MSVFDSIRENILNHFNDWIQINDYKSKWTIDSFADVGYDEEAIKPHCLEGKEKNLEECII